MSELKLCWTTCETMLRDVNKAIDALVDLREQISFITSTNLPLPTATEKDVKKEAKKIKKPRANRKTSEKDCPTLEASSTQGVQSQSPSDVDNKSVSS